MLNISYVGYHPKPLSRDLGCQKIVIYMYFYRPIKKKMFHNNFFFTFSLKKKLFVMIGFGMMNIQKKYIKMKIFDLGSYFFLSLKISFYCKEPHLVMLGIILLYTLLVLIVTYEYQKSFHSEATFCKISPRCNFNFRWSVFAFYNDLLY